MKRTNARRYAELTSKGRKFTSKPLKLTSKGRKFTSKLLKLTSKSRKLTNKPSKLTSKSAYFRRYEKSTNGTGLKFNSRKNIVPEPLKCAVE